MSIFAKTVKSSSEQTKQMISHSKLVKCGKQETMLNRHTFSSFLINYRIEATICGTHFSPHLTAQVDSRSASALLTDLVEAAAEQLETQKLVCLHKSSTHYTIKVR